MGRNGNGLHGNGREWEYEKPFPVISNAHGLGQPMGWAGLGWVQNFKGWSELGYILVFCFENDGYKFYNCTNLSQYPAF